MASLLMPLAVAAQSDRGEAASGGKAGGDASTEAPGGGSSASGTSGSDAPDEARGSGASTGSRSKPVNQHDVGDTVPAEAEIAKGFRGIDLPDADEGEGYYRTDHFIYRIDRDTRKIREVIPIRSVMLW